MLASAAAGQNAGLARVKLKLNHKSLLQALTVEEELLISIHRHLIIMLVDQSGLIRYLGIATLIAIAIFLFGFSTIVPTFSSSNACPPASSLSHKHSDHPLALKIHLAVKAAEEGRTLPLRDLRRSLFHGDQERLKKVLLKIYEGKPVKISALRGSVTQGQGLEDGGDQGVSRYSERLQAFFKDAGLANVKVT